MSNDTSTPIDRLRRAREAADAAEKAKREARELSAHCARQHLLALEELEEAKRELYAFAGGAAS